MAGLLPRQPSRVAKLFRQRPSFGPLPLGLLSPSPSSSSSTPRNFSTTLSQRVRSSALSPSTLDSLRVNSTRLWNTIHETAQWGAANRYGPAETETGLSRLALSATDKLARDWFVKEAESLGCEVTVDQVGNIYAVRPGWRSKKAKEEEASGERQGLPPPQPSPPPRAVFAGSHLDSQPSGGRYDGVLGVCSGLEMLRVLNEQGIETEGDIGVINWTNEEGARWGVSMMGSGVWAGATSLEQVWSLRDEMEGAGKGRTVKQDLEAIGYLGEREVSGRGKMRMAAHFEVHIEQGRRLEGMGKRIAVVKGVQGYVWLEVVMKGKEAHAGTTIWKDRVDPLAASSRIMWKVTKIAEAAHGLGTVGTVQVKPGSINTIPGEVRFTVDFRHEDNTKVDSMINKLKRLAMEVKKDTPGLSFEIRQLFRSNSIRFDKTAMECVEDSARAVTEDAAAIPRLMSGAGHDSVHASKQCPTAMIFVPCRDGLSHHPEEYASPEACADGASVLLQSVLRFDRARFDRVPFDRVRFTGVHKEEQ